MKDFFAKRSILCHKPPQDEVVVNLLMKWLQCHHGRTLIEWPLGRAKHLVHQMLLAARENEMGIMYKLDV